MVITYLGGCINRQKDIPLKKHHHFILRKNILDLTGDPPTVRLNNYQSYYGLSSLVKEVVSEPTDVLILFIRPFPMHTLMKPVLRYKDIRNRSQIILHPAISKKEFPDNVANEFGTGIESYRHEGIAHSFLAIANILGGHFFSLHQWAIMHLERQLIDAAQYCNAASTKLIIAGPPLYPAHIHINKLCVDVNNRVTELCPALGIFHAGLLSPLDNNHEEIFAPDGIHFNETGHAYIANVIFNIITKW